MNNDAIKDELLSPVGLTDALATSFYPIHYKFNFTSIFINFALLKLQNLLLSKTLLHEHSFYKLAMPPK
jgi:hypothetical protein